MNDEFEAFGTQFLPRVTEGLKFFTENILPGLSETLPKVADVFTSFIDKSIAPLVDSFDDLSKALGFKDGFALIVETLKLALIPLEVVAAVVKGIVDGITTAIKLLNSLSSSKTAALLSGNARTSYLSGGNLGVAAPMGGSTYLDTTIQFNIGTQKQDKLVSDSLIRQGTGRRGGY